MRTRPLLASLLLLVAACSSDITNPVVTEPSASAWSGSSFALLSASFHGIDSLPLVMVGAETLAVRRSADSVLATLPDTNGTITLTVRLHGGGQATADVHVYGFRGTSTGPAFDNGWGIRWSFRGPTMLLGIVNGRLISFDVATGSTIAASNDTGLSGSSWPLATPSLLDTGLVAVPTGSGKPWIAAAFHGASAVSDTGPGVGVVGWYVHLARGLWLVQGEWQWTATATGSGFVNGATVLGCRQPLNIAVSPRRDRLVFEYCRAVGPDSTPVFDGLTGAVAFRAGRGSGGATFSPGGDTLFLTTNPAYGSDTLRILNATTGAPFAMIAIPSGAAGGIVLDPAHPLLYLSQGQDVFVYDRATLQLVATLRGRPLAGSQFDTDLFIDPAARRLYAVGKATGVAPAQINQFDLMP